MLNKYIYVIIISLSATLVHAISWQQLWLNNNQQGVELVHIKHNKQALKKLTNKAWMGVAYYNESNYAKAYEAFSQESSATSLYNQGNALANLQKYQQAIAKYKQSLKLQANNPDARYNIKLLEQLLKQQQQKQQQSGSKQNNKQNDSDSKQADKSNNQHNTNQGNTKSSNNQPKDKEQAGNKETNQTKQPQSDNNPKQGSPENNKASADAKNKPEQKDKSMQQDSKAQPANPSDTKAKDTKKANQGTELTSKPLNKTPAQTTTRAQATKATSKDEQVQQILSRVPDDPGGLLRNKFMRDYQKQQRGDND